MIYLIMAMTSANDIRVRCSIRSQLESADLMKVFQKIRAWRDEQTIRMIRQYEEEAERDRQDLMEEADLDLLKSTRSPKDVFEALMQKTKGSKASAHLLDSMRHLLLIKAEGEEKVRYFQLIDQLITSVVMNDSPDLGHDFSRAFGMSVTNVISKFVEQERVDKAVDEVRELKIALATAHREKAALVEEVAIGNDGLVGQLKAHVAELEEKLRNSRNATESIEDQMGKMKRDYEERIKELDAVIQELFNMLRETTHLDQVTAMSDGPVDRAQLIHQLRLQWERKKTIRKLEGRDMRDQRIAKLERVGEDDEVEAEVVQAEKGSMVKAEKKHMSGSQFADAEEERVRAHIELSLVKGADHIVSSSFLTLMVRADDSLPRHARLDAMARRLLDVRHETPLPSARSQLNDSRVDSPRNPAYHPDSSKNFATRLYRDHSLNQSLINWTIALSASLA
jgi:cytokinesis protein